MEGVGESCCRCVPPGEWVWGAAEEFQGEDDGRESEVAAPSPGGWGPLRLGLSLCPPPLTSPTRSPLRVLSFLWLRWAGSGSFLVPSKSNHDQAGLFKIVFTWKLSHK